MAYVREKAARESAAALTEEGPFRKRLLELGITDQQLDKTLEYIRHRAPIIIHLRVPCVLELLIRDTHYRSQFETGTSFGLLSHSARNAAEGLMFNRAYLKPEVTAFEKCKYGVMNFTISTDGVQVPEYRIYFFQ